MEFLPALAAALQTTEKNAIARAAGLRILPTCGRCGGGGRYSYNQMSGDTCFGCGGSGQIAPSKAKQAATLAEAQAAATDGRLASYLEYLAARKRTKSAIAAAMQAWTETGVSALYNWRNSYATSPTFNARDMEISGFNGRICAAYKSVEDAAYDRALDKPDTRQAATLKLDATLSAALATIAAAKADLDAYLAANPKPEKATP